MLYLVLSRYWYRTFIQTYSATSPLKSTLGNGQNFFAKLLSKSNNLCGSGSGRIFELPLLQKKDRFHRFQLPLPASASTSLATTHQFITAKISGCVLQQGSKTPSSLRQSNLQRKNQAALMSCRIRAVEHRCGTGLAGAHPGLQDRILLNYTTRLPTCFHQKKPGLVPTKPEKPR